MHHKQEELSLEVNAREHNVKSNQLWTKKDRAGKTSEAASMKEP